MTTLQELDTKELKIKELTTKEAKEIQGGAIFRWTGFLDGIKGNGKICFFC
ncbi:hypothetical protein [Pseudotamlana carrageenivorans]|uniref:hypothetical protein n=1 Tax=Pseudotamlana carrageenivorans TaxID=2069432 RepID=UPI0013154133|nr:hypothetical protein [Tamlana carrageenivorans]